MAGTAGIVKARLEPGRPGKRWRKQARWAEVNGCAPQPSLACTCARCYAKQSFTHGCTGASQPLSRILFRAQPSQLLLPAPPQASQVTLLQLADKHQQALPLQGNSYQQRLELLAAHTQVQAAEAQLAAAEAVGPAAGTGAVMQQQQQPQDQQQQTG